MKIIAQSRWKYIIQTKGSYSYWCMLSEKRRNLTQIKIQTLDFHKVLKGLINNRHCRVNSRLMAEKKNPLKKGMPSEKWNHLTLKTHCKNKELIYCISGRNTYEKELDLQMNWYWIRTRYSPERLYRSLGQPTLIRVRIWIKIDPLVFATISLVCFGVQEKQSWKK